MTPIELFEKLAPLVGPKLEAEWERRDLCVLATAAVIDVARYFDIEVQPCPVKLFVHNAQWTTHVVDGQWTGGDPHKLTDGSWSVGVGYGAKPEPGRWDGHLIAVVDGLFGDFTIQQAERREHGIVTGPAIVGPKSGEKWLCERDGTTVIYRVSGDASFKRGPDWRDKARRKRIVGQLIRVVREASDACA